MKKLILGLTGILLSFSMFAENSAILNPIVTTVPSLYIAPDARAGGMGETGAATMPDGNSQFWNASKYAFMTDKGGVSVNYTPWLSKIVSGIHLASAVGYGRIGEHNFISGSLRYFTMGKVNITMPDGSNSGDCTPYEMALDIAYARRLAKNWSAAVTLRYVRVDFAASEYLTPANAFAADVSVSYRQHVNIGQHKGAVGAGIVFSNLGTKITYDGGQNMYYLPANMRIGVSFDCPIDEYNRISFSVDANKLLVPSWPQGKNYSSIEEYNEAMTKYKEESSLSAAFRSFGDSSPLEEFQEVAWGIGAEYAYDNKFMVRAGYFYENSLKGNRNFWTFGAGFNLSVFSLDASYTLANSTSPLDQTLRFTLGLNFGRLKELVY